MSGPPGSKRLSADDVRAAKGRSIPDVIATDLRVLFCGINPGLYSAAAGHHFGRPGNRFWPALHQAGFTPRVLAPHEGCELLASGYGVTSLVRRATATARELERSELVAGHRRLERKVRRYRPHWVAVFGVEAYRTAFRRLHAQVGRQEGALAMSRVWVLPSPSGANGSYPLVALTRELRAFYEAVHESEPL